MTNDILKIQIETDLEEILRNILEGYYNENEEEYKKDVERLEEKAKQLNQPLWTLLKWCEIKDKVLRQYK